MNQKERPDIVYGKTISIKCGCGCCFITLNLDDEKKPFEVFIKMGKAGGCATATSEAIARLLSWGLRSGAELTDAIHHLRGIQCNIPVHDGPVSCVDALAIGLIKLLEENYENTRSL
jgi:hypothetical protein